ncbi:MAG: hypothetical protein LBK60_04050 [Verrucomicrobiales bacterium]|jgi:glucose-6-phosphate-specific signal transduction histidine kinase|nr:hypothetical protein [Verrucomicrobiales bacterium]
MTWPSLHLVESLGAWWCVSVSVIIEGVIFWLVGKMRWWRALIGTLAANGVAKFTGTILLLPIAGLWLEFFADSTYKNWLPRDAFNPLTWMLTGLLAIVINTLIDSVVLWLCGLSDWTRRLIFSVLIANTVSVAIAYLVLFYFPNAIFQ